MYSEGSFPDSETVTNVDEVPKKSKQKIQTDGHGLGLDSLKHPKTWKKSLTSFFRNQLRSSRSNDGDTPEVRNNEKYQDYEITHEQKWQSLGKMFKRPSLTSENWEKSHDQGECSSQHKRNPVRKVISTYFGKKKMLDISNSSRETEE